MHNEIVNKIRYNDLGKPMKQTSFTVKNLGENLSEKQFIIVKRSFRSTEKQFIIVKRSFRSSTKLLSLDSTILVDELTTETIYRFRTFELSNI